MSQLYVILRKLILPIENINSAIPKRGTIVDLGCGQGQISLYLAQTKTRKIIGIDNNTKRLQKSPQKNLKFRKGDITKISLGRIDGAVISDVLHHLSVNNQRSLIQKVFKNLTKNGIFVIKEIDTGEFIRSKLSRMWDFIFYPEDEINYWNKSDLEKYLKRLGFKSIHVTRPCRFFPGSTTLFVCTK